MFLSFPVVERKKEKARREAGLFLSEWRVAYAASLLSSPGLSLFSRLGVP